MMKSEEATTVTMKRLPGTWYLVSSLRTGTRHKTHDCRDGRQPTTAAAVENTNTPGIGDTVPLFVPLLSRRAHAITPPGIEYLLRFRLLHTTTYLVHYYGLRIAIIIIYFEVLNTW